MIQQLRVWLATVEFSYEYVDTGSPLPMITCRRCKSRHNVSACPGCGLIERGYPR